MIKLPFLHLSQLESATRVRPVTMLDAAVCMPAISADAHRIKGGLV